ncbi:MAG: hypothetical protein IKQ87_00960 [Clostridia bacterium]|nr:hypothetical protein [Clostridia bacterium]
MKCAAKAVQNDNAYNANHRQYGMLLLGCAEAAAAYYAAAEYPAVRRPGAAESLIMDAEDWMLDAVKDAIPETMRKTDGRRRVWADELEREDEAVQDALYRWQEDFREYGFRDVHLADTEPGPLPPVTGWESEDVRRARVMRAEYMAARGRDALRLFTYCLFCRFRERGFSAARLDGRVYAPYAAEIRTWTERFLTADRESTRRMLLRTSELRARLEAHGIGLDNTESGRMTSSAGEGTPSAGSADSSLGEGTPSASSADSSLGEVAPSAGCADSSLGEGAGEVPEAYKILLEQVKGKGFRYGRI